MPREVKAYIDPITGDIYKTAKEAAAAENKLNKRKYEALLKKIKSGKYWVPKVGEYIYMDTRISCDHGWDDVVGGLATVTRAYESMSGGDPKCIFIEIAQHDRGGNWTQFLFEDQKELQKQWKKNFAYPDPDERDFYDPHEWQ
jgi:hypothetical protein